MAHPANSNTFLSVDELQLLTGAKSKRKQIATLRRQLIRHYINAEGRPVVPRSSVVVESSAPAIPTWIPAKNGRNEKS